MGLPERQTARPASASEGSNRVLVADDDPLVSRTLSRVLSTAGYQVVCVSDGNAAVDAMTTETFDVVLSDIYMPGASGVDLLRFIQAYDLDVPVILFTGQPEVETALDAIDLSVVGYLRKPVSHDELLRVVARAAGAHRAARAKQITPAQMTAATPQTAHERELGSGFGRVLDTLSIALQPIVSIGEKRVIAYEALLRTREPTLPNPEAVLRAAETLGRVEELGRHVRDRAAAAFRNAPPEALLFVNLHPRELLDSSLASSKAPLSSIASRVVLEITERAALSELKDVERRISVLRYMGFRIAIDDLGAAYAGLESFARLEPDFVKLDMSLIRGLQRSPGRRRLVRAIVRLSNEMGTTVIAEGIETPDERHHLRVLGCDLMQGYLFARPQEGFASVSFD